MRMIPPVIPQGPLHADASHCTVMCLPFQEVLRRNRDHLKESGLVVVPSRGDTGIRTRDLLHAMQSRYLLRHIPESRTAMSDMGDSCNGPAVECTRFELVTPSLRTRCATAAPTPRGGYPKASMRLSLRLLGSRGGPPGI